MTKNAISPFGTNSFDRLSEAGIVGSKPLPDEATVKAKLDAKIIKLGEIDVHLTKVQTATAKLYVMPKVKQLKQITAALKATKALVAAKGMPVGTKVPLTACLNELTSLREGIFTGAATDKKSLTLIFAQKARNAIAELIASAHDRKTRLEAESHTDSDLDSFYKKAEDVIQRNGTESEKLESIKDKPFAIVRVPIVPVGTKMASNIPMTLSIERLRRQGFKCESIGGYAVLQNQMVLGIASQGIKKTKTSEIKTSKKSSEILEEAEHILKLISKETKSKLQFVSQKAIGKNGASWFWIMPERELDMLAKVSGGTVNIPMWGFAFN